MSCRLRLATTEAKKRFFWEAGESLSRVGFKYKLDKVKLIPGTFECPCQACSPAVNHRQRIL